MSHRPDEPFALDPSTPSGGNRIAVDWDGTCVENAWPAMGDWLPGAREALHAMLHAGYDVMIHSTRLAKVQIDEVTPYDGHEEEVRQIREMLDQAHLHTVGIWLHDWKPGALFYIDDKALRFEGDWVATLGRVLAEGLDIIPEEQFAELTERQRDALTEVYVAPPAKPARHPNSERFHELVADIGELHDRKQADYGSDSDPFANVRASEEWGIASWVGALVRLNDKVTRLKSFARKGSLANESAEDSMRDIAVYALIALVLYEQEDKS